ncbi:lasso peptide biosynthesis B2 protein [Streptomyces armeniacus]|uniref:Lasso peptide biosynthesis B2 protein n=1 Tax=Streptomyces armeniacus TaxID=83291 RepID=A0A345XMV2_9ACTN|nr:lasso peptide biosynthesis B2 protein [Streptomyces armeniacus]AXK32968.1 lasso peptide biosynthesis B2 protein [Streptomyces armeniacus]
MSYDVVLPTHDRLPFRRRPSALLAVAAARLLATLPPYRIGQVLRTLRRRAAPATAGQASNARLAVVTVSRRCTSPQGCLQRSLATALLCRLRGVWPTWCTGVRTQPFSAHAWVAVDGTPIDEPQAADYYTPVLAVPPRRRP